MKKLTTGLIGLLLALVLCVSLLPVTAQAADTPSVENWNIALKDNIVVNFNVNVPDVSNTTISATVNGAAVETSQSVSGNICTVSVSLAAAQLNDSIKLIYNVNDTQSESREYTVKEYAGYISDGKYDVAVKQMVNQMLSYGGAAQNYFNYNTGAMANAGVDNLYANVTLPTDVPALSVNDNLAKVRYYGTSLVFRSQVYARFYFVMDDRNAEINNYVVTINGQDCPYGKFYDPEGRFNYFADSPGITPNNYDKPLEVVITNTVDNTTLTVSYSPLNYIVNQASSSTANLPELMKAMYGYHVESYQYVNYENAVGTTFNSLLGYGKNGIQYDEISKVQLIFAGAAANSMPVTQDYYPQSADCIKLVRNGDFENPISVADVTMPAIQKRSEDAYHIYATNLTVELQDQDVLIVEGKFSTDRADTYYDGETMNIAKAYVYVDLFYDHQAEITGTEPVLWQTINVGPFYTHSQSQNDYKYMAADENDMPVGIPGGDAWGASYLATGNASLVHVHDGVALQISDGFLYDAHKIALTEEVKPAEPYLTMDVQIDTLGGNWENDIEVRFYNYSFEGNPHEDPYTDLVTFREGVKQTVTLDATKYLVDGKLTGIGIGIFGGPEWNTQISDGVYDRHTVTISNVTLEGTQSVDFDLSKSTIASGTNNTGYTSGNGSGTAVFGENIVISNGFRYDVHKISLVQHTNTYITMDVQIDTLGGNWENDIEVRFYNYGFEGNPYDTYTDRVTTFREGVKQTVTLDATNYLVNGKLTGIGIAIFGGPAWDAKLPDGSTPDRHTVSISNVKLEGAQSADFDLTQSTVASGTADTGFTDGNGNGTAAIVDYVSDFLDVNGLLIKKWGAKDYYIEGGVYNSITLQDDEYFILKGEFKHDELRIVINVAKTYISKDVYNGEIITGGELKKWQVVDVGPFYTHANSNNFTSNDPKPYRYMAADENTVPVGYNGDAWGGSYIPTDNVSLTYVQNGASTNLSTDGLLIKKWGTKDYYIEGGAYNTTTLQNGEYYILEGRFEHTGLKVAMNIAKTYIYRDTHSGEVTIAGTLPSDIPCIDWLKVGQNDAWLAGNTSTIDGLTHYDGGVYASFPTVNVTHGGGTWGCVYNSTSVDNVKIIRNGVTTSVSRAGASALDMYDENYMYIKFHTRWSVDHTDENGNPSPLQAGDILIVEGTFKHETTGEKVWIEKTYITLFADGTTGFSATMPVSHTVNLDAAGGTCSDATLTTTTGGKVTLPDATRTHYTFGGWSDGTTTYAAGEKLTVTSDMNLTAQWTIIQYTVNYNYNGGSGSPASATVNAGSAVTLPTPDARDGYRFTGWYTAASGGTKVGDANASYTPTGNVTLYAQWIAQYTVTYNLDGGSGTANSVTVDAGTTINLADAPSKSNYTFSGWSDGSITYNAGASYTVNGNVTLTAQWTIIQYTVTYNANGGSVSPTSKTVNAGDSVTLPTPTRDGYTFNGWFTASTGGSIVGAADASYKPEGNVTLYAQWTEESSGDNCIAEGTLITLADGNQKKVEDLTMEDRLLSFNHETGEYIETAILFIESDDSDWYNVINLEFANGATTHLIFEHALFDLDLNKYVYITEQNYADYVGHRFAQQDGTATELLNAYITNEYVGCYSLVTDYHLNYFIEGLFSIPGGIEGLFNIFEYDENMVYDAQKMADDIETYGLFTYEDFADYGVSEEMFNAFPTKYLKVSIGKGYITMERIEYLIQRYGVYFQ